MNDDALPSKQKAKLDVQMLNAKNGFNCDQ